MNRLPRTGSTAIGLLFLLGMVPTLGAPYLLASAELGGERRVSDLFTSVGLPLQVVAAVYLLACLALAGLGFAAIKGRAVSVGVQLWVIASPAVTGLIAGRASMGALATKVLRVADAARPAEIGNGLVVSAWPLLAGVLAAAALLFAFCWSLLWAHLALHKRGVGGSLSLLSAAAWLPGAAAVAVTVYLRTRGWPRPPDHCAFAWLAAGLFALAVPFAAPASRGLKSFADREAAQAALRRLATLGWALPLAVGLLWLAHDFHLIAEGLQSAAQGGGAGAITQAEAQLRAGWLDLAWNAGLALLAVAPLLFFGGALRAAFSGRAPDAWALALLAVLVLGGVWFQSGRRSLISLAHVSDPALDRFAGADVPEGSAPSQLLDGPALWMIGGANLQWDPGGGHLVPLAEGAGASGELTSVRVVASASQPFFRLSHALTTLATGRSISFRLVERRAQLPGGQELSALARLFLPPESKLGALAFRWQPRVDLAHLEALEPNEPPEAVLGVRLDDRVLRLTAVPGGDQWELPLDSPPNEALRGVRGRLDESPWVVFSVGTNDKVETVTAAADLLAQSNVLELVLTPDVRELSQPPSE